MRHSLLPALLSSLALLAACSQEVATGADAGSEATDAADEPGLDASAQAPRDAGVSKPDAAVTPPDASGPQQVITVSCVGPILPVRANTRVDVNCTVDNGGKAVSASTLTVSPSAGTVLQKGSGDLQMAFSLSTGSYQHPVDFADTTYTLTYEVHDAAEANKFGKATAAVTVLGNYWMGDLFEAGSSGVIAYASDGTPIGGAIGPTAVSGVYDLRTLPDGNVVVAARGQKAIKVFTRKGALVPRTFPDTDPFTSQGLWTTTYTDAGPHQMTVAGDDLWVAGAREGSVWGLAVFNWKTGAFQKFVPSPLNSSGGDFQFTSIVARPDGTILASSSERRAICLFDAATYAAKGATPCAAVGDEWCGGWSSFVVLASGAVVGSQGGISNNAGCPFSFIGPNLEITGSKKSPEAITVFGMVESGAEIAGIAASEITTEGFFIRVDPATLATQSADWRVIKTVAGSGLLKPSGLLRLTP
ncbi:MAG TPA: hypothetical protein VGK67_40205 [Myxococcales bacterium]|jgi:hypothetical protein